jgi:hypothetical protein
MKGRDLLRSAFSETTTFRVDVVVVIVVVVLGANAETDATKRATREATTVVVFNMMMVVCDGVVRI